jgi:hypothetical protein
LYGADETAKTACNTLNTHRYEVSAVLTGMTFQVSSVYHRLQLSEIEAPTPTTPQVGDVLLSVNNINVYTNQEWLLEMQRGLVDGQAPPQKEVIFGRAATIESSGDNSNSDDDDGSINDTASTAASTTSNTSTAGAPTIALPDQVSSVCDIVLGLCFTFSI